jgi:hypothetical protein
MDDLKKYLKEICKIYKVKLVFKNNTEGGIYWKNKITIDSHLSRNELIDIFCHELGHYFNDLENKYPVYHKEDAYKAIKRMGLKKYARYALEAEVYTEKRGKEIAKVWFPKHKYKSSYLKNSYWLGFFNGYYLS